MEGAPINNPADAIENTKSPEEEFKELLLQKFPLEKYGAGMDLDRVQNFVGGAGFKPTDFVILDEENRYALFDLMGIPRPTADPESHKQGQFCTNLNLAMIVRDPIYDQIEGGKVFQEGVLVHELGHGSGSRFMENITTSSGPSIHLARVGSFIEEGYADMERVKYIEQNITPELRTKMTEESNKESLDSMVGLVYYDDDDKEKRFRVPLKYMIPAPSIARDEDKNAAPNLMLTLGTPGIAAYGMDLLCTKIPNLREWLTEARKNNVDFDNFGIHFSEQLGGEQSDNYRLFQRLAELNYDTEDFLEGLEIVSNFVGEKPNDLIPAKDWLKIEREKYELKNADPDNLLSSNDWLQEARKESSGEI